MEKQRKLLEEEARMRKENKTKQEGEIIDTLQIKREKI